MKYRNFVSLMVVLSFSVLSVTGLMIFFNLSTHFIDVLHSTFGIVFILAVIPHVVNNFKILKNYISR